ncbi:MAG: oxygen-independent coproporphyrinogen III oxidase [Bacteroidota bacterium]|nr:oxygen-independent coproporphyrinogen III oxidase [Bacteroidota bacterium]
MIEFPSLADLIRKYDVPTPRYTSYPTVPFWKTDQFTTEKWIAAVRRTFEESNDTKGISLYVHLPYCESLCTYCACNKRITKNHSVEIDYIQTLLKEWSHYLGIFGRKPLIRELHLGGGTPTFFSPENLKWLVSYLLEEGVVHKENQFSFEGHPNNTSGAHLRTLFALGFRRVSFGVQDLDPVVQKAINRVQPFENVETVTRLSRAIGYESISFDLIYGLPHQTIRTIERTIGQVLNLRPDRVSFYSYAHVPWVSPGQRGYGERDLPSDVQKRELYETGRRLLKESGYEDVGMDHFALPHDSLWHAQQKGHLHRNFMGYTQTQTDLLLGLGASSISDAKYAYAQNRKKVEDYSDTIRNGMLAVFKGHAMTDEDIHSRECILRIACDGTIPLEAVRSEEVGRSLRGMCREGILIHNSHGYHVTELGRAFIRNICSLFDDNLRSATIEGATPIFSKSI